MEENKYEKQVEEFIISDYKEREKSDPLQGYVDRMIKDFMNYLKVRHFENLEAIFKKEDELKIHFGEFLDNQ